MCLLGRNARRPVRNGGGSGLWFQAGRGTGTLRRLPPPRIELTAAWGPASPGIHLCWCVISVLLDLIDFIVVLEAVKVAHHEEDHWSQCSRNPG